jgi:hypothetical protein
MHQTGRLYRLKNLKELISPENVQRRILLFLKCGALEPDRAI